MGIRHDAPLLLLSPPDPLCWAPAGAPFSVQTESYQRTVKGERDFEYPTPFVPSGHFPLIGGIGLSPLKSPLLETTNLVLADFISFAWP